MKQRFLFGGARLVALLLCMVLLGGLLATTAFAQSAAVPSLSATEREILALINEERARQSLAPLSASTTLQAASDLRAQELFASFSHTRPNGQSCFTALSDAGVSYRSAGENIALGYADAPSVVTAWMNSEGHRANILNASFVHVGVSRVVQKGQAADANLFIGGCAAHTLTLSQSNLTLPKGSSLATAQITATVHCAAHGQSYFPVTDALCIGFAPNAVGTQHLTISAGEAKASLTVTVTDGEGAASGYADVAQDAWYRTGVTYVTEHGWMQGESADRFAPDKTITRGMAVTVLGRIAGVRIAAYPSARFSDTPAGAWYTPYAAWASEVGVTDGVGDGRFAPDAALTREQFCVMLYRFAQQNGAAAGSGAALTFSDSARISDWAREAVAYAVAQGWVQGLDDGSFAPQQPLTRAQAAVLLARFGQSTGR